jgi:ankyrin repeat protein
MVESLISSGVDVNARLPRSSKPPALVHAAQKVRKEIVDILLRANARLNETDARGSTACHAAAEFGRHGVLAVLLARQPNLDVVDECGKTALCCAAVYSRRAVGHSGDDDVRVVLMLLEAGASVVLVDRDYLCEFASTSTVAVRTLIDRGVDVREIVGAIGNTPLHHAAGFTRDAV